VNQTTVSISVQFTKQVSEPERSGKDFRHVEKSNHERRGDSALSEHAQCYFHINERHVVACAQKKQSYEYGTICGSRGNQGLCKRNQRDGPLTCKQSSFSNGHYRCSIKYSVICQYLSSIQLNRIPDGVEHNGSFRLGCRHPIRS